MAERRRDRDRQGEDAGEGEEDRRHRAADRAAAPPVSGGGIPRHAPIDPPLMTFRLALRIALRHLRARLRQTLLATLGIVIGGGIFALMVAITEGQTRLLREKLIDLSPHIL